MIEMKLAHIDESTITSEYGCAFIYRLLSCGKIVYVGQTKNIKRRMQQHASSEKEFDSVQFYPCKISSSTQIERDEILKFNPPLNKGLPKTDKYITLKQASTASSKKVADQMFSYLNIIFKGSKESINGRDYVLSSDVDKQTEILTDLINKLYTKECK